MSRSFLNKGRMFLHRSRRKLFPPAPWGPPVLAGACLLLAALVFLRVSLSAAKSLPAQEDSSLAQSISVGDASEETVWDEGEEPESQEDSAASSSLSQAVLQPEALQAGEYLSSASMEEGDISQEEVLDALEALRDVFPEGWYWNHVGVEDWDEFTVTQYSCQHDLYWDTYCNTYVGATQTLFPQYYPLEQCLGFASLLSDLIFGEDAPLTVFYDYSQLRPGDHIRLELTEHSMTVLSVEEDGITVVECNSDYEHCRISWDRFLSWDDLASYSYEMECITRYED